MPLMDNGGGLVVLICAVLAPFLAYQGLMAFLASGAPWQSGGIALLAVVGLLGLWALLGKAKVTGLGLARKTVGQLEQEQGERGRILTIAWVLFAAAVALVLVVLVGSGL